MRKVNKLESLTLAAAWMTLTPSVAPLDPSMSYDIEVEYVGFWDVAIPRKELFIVSWPSLFMFIILLVFLLNCVVLVGIGISNTIS